jgi:SAM-dependent methyltransferase
MLGAARISANRGVKRMSAKDFIAGQLRRPTGCFGRYIAARYMTWVNVEINQRTLEALSVLPDDRILEVGPGPGDLMNRIVPMVPRGSVTGVDFSPEMIDVCSKRFAALIESGRIELRCASADAMPFAGDQFTKACTVHTIYFWPDPAAVFREFWRVLRERGRLVVAFFPVVALEKLRATAAFARYDGEEVARLMEQAGFRDIRVVAGKDRRGEFLCVAGSKHANSPRQVQSQSRI